MQDTIRCGVISWAARCTTMRGVVRCDARYDTVAMTCSRWCDVFSRVSPHPTFYVVYIRFSRLALYLGPKIHTIAIPGVLTTDTWSHCPTALRIAETALQLSVHHKESVKFVHLPISPCHWWTFLIPFTINLPKLVYSDDSVSVVWARTRAYSSGAYRKYLPRVQTISSVMILRLIIGLRHSPGVVYGPSLGNNP